MVGEVDQCIGQHVFRLVESLPHPVTLAITRDRNAAGARYINAYTAALKAGDRPLAGRRVTFTVRASERNRLSYKTKRIAGMTDAKGRARIALPSFDACIDIHRDYTVRAELAPGPGERNLTRARSMEYPAYRMTATAGKTHTYSFYVALRRLFVLPEIIVRFPELPVLVRTMGQKPAFSSAEARAALGIDRSRGGKIAALLAKHRVLRAAARGRYRWNEVDVTDVSPITSEDDFTA